MLKDLNKTELKQGDVAIIRLISGEELIAKVDDATDTSVSIIQPLMLGLTQSPHGQPAVGLAPFVFGIDEKKAITIDSAKWIFITKARKEAADQYTQSTSSIIQASTGGGMPDLSGIDLSKLGK